MGIIKNFISPFDEQIKNWESTESWCGVLNGNHNYKHQEKIIKRNNKLFRRIICKHTNKYKEIELEQIK